MARIRSLMVCLLLFASGILYASPSVLIIPSVASDRFSIVPAGGTFVDYPMYDAVEVSGDGDVYYSLSEYESSVFYRIELQGLEKNSLYPLDISYVSDYAYHSSVDSTCQRAYKVFAYPDVVDQDRYSRELGNDKKTLTVLSDEEGSAEVFLVLVLPALDSNAVLNSGSYVTTGDLLLTLRKSSDKAKVLSTSLHVMGRGYYNSGFYDFCALDVRRTGMDVDLSDSVSVQSVGEISAYISYTAADTNPRTTIFLSSSPDPFYNAGKPFVFIHESVMKNSGVAFLDGKNAIGYEALLEGDGKIAYFDGKDALFLDKTENLYKAKNGILLDNESKNVVTSGGVQTPVYTQSFEGKISLRINGNNEGLQGGRYTSDIYIHVFPAQ